MTVQEWCVHGRSLARWLVHSIWPSIFLLLLLLRLFAATENIGQSSLRSVKLLGPENSVHTKCHLHSELAVDCWRWQKRCFKKINKWTNEHKLNAMERKNGWKRKHPKWNRHNTYLFYWIFDVVAVCVCVSRKEGHREILICTSKFARLHARSSDRLVGWLVVFSFASIYKHSFPPLPTLPPNSFSIARKTLIQKQIATANVIHSLPFVYLFFMYNLNRNDREKFIIRCEWSEACRFVFSV